MTFQTDISNTTWRDYVALTKPRIIVLLLITAVCGMFLAAGGLPDAGIIVFVLLGGALAAGGANSLNHFLDRDIDQLMRRTTNRPVARGQLPPRDALVFGIVLNIMAFAILGLLVNPLAAFLAIGATLFYVFVYTMGLKRTTPQNIVIGGAAGAIPPVVGWVAVTGQLDLAAIYLFAIVFFWTPPHFWALSLLLKDDYAKAGVPMLPVVTSVDETKRQILLYTVLLTALTTMFFVTQTVGLIYLTSSLVLGVGFIAFAGLLLMGQGIRHAASTYKYSLAYLALLFVTIAVDGVVHL